MAEDSGHRADPRQSGGPSLTGPDVMRLYDAARIKWRERLAVAIPDSCTLLDSIALIVVMNEAQVGIWTDAWDICAKADDDPKHHMLEILNMFRPPVVHAIRFLLETVTSANPHIAHEARGNVVRRDEKS